MVGLELNDPFRYVKAVVTEKEPMSTLAKVPPPRRASIGARRNPESAAAVLSAARELLVEKGYAGFSVDEVARRAGAGKPTIYRWWPTKADLFITIYGAEKTAAIAVPDRGCLADDLVDYTVALWRFWRSNPAGGAFRGLIAEAQASQAALTALREKFLPERLEPLRTIFSRGVARNEVKAIEIEDRIALWVGFNWFRLLTGQIDEDGQAIARAMKAIVGPPLEQGSTQKGRPDSPPR
jgi:AcrR family transcriptional regulator